VAVVNAQKLARVRATMVGEAPIAPKTSHAQGPLPSAWAMASVSAMVSASASLVSLRVIVQWVPLSVLGIVRVMAIAVPPRNVFVNTASPAWIAAHHS